MSYVDLYCERVEPGLLSEPANALSNIAIVVAAWFAWQYARQRNEQTAGILLLVALIVAFGLGSGLFHTFANVTTRVLDAVPIAAFVAAYLWIYVHRVLGGARVISTVCVMVFVVAAIFARQFPELLNGSIIYAPALLLAVAGGLVHSVRCRYERFSLLGAAGVFVLALVFRTMDNPVCESFPLGTHFLWHLLNAAAIYLAMRALIVGLQSRSPA